MKSITITIISILKELIETHPECEIRPYDVGLNFKFNKFSCYFWLSIDKSLIYMEGANSNEFIRMNFTAKMMATHAKCRECFNQFLSELS